MFCSQCGTKNDDNAKFCSSCGASVVDAVNTPTKTKETNSWLSVLGVIALIVLGVVIWVWLATLGDRMEASRIEEKTAREAAREAARVAAQSPEQRAAEQAAKATMGKNIVLENNQQNCGKVDGYSANTTEQIAARLGVSMSSVRFLGARWMFGSHRMSNDCIFVFDTEKGPLHCFANELLSNDNGRTAFGVVYALACATP